MVDNWVEDAINFGRIFCANLERNIYAHLTQAAMENRLSAIPPRSQRFSRHPVSLRAAAVALFKRLGEYDGDIALRGLARHTLYLHQLPYTVHARVLQHLGVTFPLAN